MSLAVEPERVPLATSRDGVVRVGETRVTLDTVVAAFREGATAEEISQQYPTLRLADIYAVIGYYLRHRADVDTYIDGRLSQGAQVRRENEVRFDPTGLRERLLARRTQ